jgi:hypothetical protein
MKNRFFFLSVFLILTLSNCKKEKITCIITSPEDFAVFSEDQSIPVTVEASTTKGSIIQVQIFVNDSAILSLTAAPYHFTIPPKTISVGNMITLSAVAYSSEGNQEVAAIFIDVEN